MRRDVGFFIEADITQVYDAYLKAATAKPFERTCKVIPFHTISFGVNYSFKYNMNGGSCNIHFMPCNGGTAVNMRFSIAQAAGARYEKYARDLNNALRAYLPMVPQPAKYNMDDFLKPENQVIPAMIQPDYSPQPTVPAPQPTPVAPKPNAKFCIKCGKALMSGGNFCCYCGAKL